MKYLQRFGIRICPAVIVRMTCLFVAVVFGLLNFPVGALVQAQDEQGTSSGSGDGEGLEGIEMQAVTFDGRAIKSKYAPIFPSFAHPSLVVDKFEVVDLRLTSDQEILCSIVVSGEFHPSQEGVVEISSPTKDLGSVYINGDEESFTQIPVKELSTNAEWKSSQRFESKILDVAVTEGNNTFRVAFPDPVTGIEGGQMVSFIIEYPETDDGVPTLGEVEKLGSDGAGEAHTFGLMVRGITKPQAEGLQIELGEGSEAILCDLSQIGDGENFLLTHPGNKTPRNFVLLPSQGKADQRHIRRLMKFSEGAKLKEQFTDRDLFLAGYGIGVYAYGADLVATDGSLLKNAGRVSDKTGLLELDARWKKAGSAEGSFRFSVPAGFDPTHLQNVDGAELAGLFWKIAELYRKGDPMTDDVALALLLSDYEDLWPGYEMGGWRGEFLIKVSTPVEEVNDSYKESSPMNHGFMMGMLVAIGSQVDTPPRPEKGSWTSPPISGVLAHFLKQTAFFSAEASQDVEERDSTVEVPEKYQGVWPYVKWFYEGEYQYDESKHEMAGVLPDSVKHPAIPPILIIVAVFGMFAGSIWFLVTEFQASVWWGLGQLAANAASCLLVIPGMIVAIVFLCIHPKRGARPFMFVIVAFLLGVLAMLFVPSWAYPKD